MNTTFTTFTNAIPLRLNRFHYRIESQAKARAGKTYNLHYNHTTRKWECECADFRINHNPSCKHVRRLIQYIKERDAQRIQAQAEEVAQLAQEQAEQDAQGDLRTLVEAQAGQIAALQAQVAELAQQLAHLASTPASIAIKADRITIDAPVARAKTTSGQGEPAKAEPKPKAEIIEITRNGQIVACMIDSYRVLVNGGFSMACTCDKGNDGHQCQHTPLIDGYLQARQERPAPVAPGKRETTPEERETAPLAGSGKAFSLF